MLHKLLTYFENNQKKLLMLDGFGALLTAFCLGIVLVKFEYFFGIPASMLRWLAIIPIAYLIYDLYFIVKPASPAPFVFRGIAVLNLLYCIISIGLAIANKDVLKIWGWLYLINEVAIILTIVAIEFGLAKRLDKVSH